MVMKSSTKAVYEDYYILWRGNAYHEQTEKKSKKFVRIFKALFDTALVTGKHE